jgi:hypothetical protein
MSVYEMNFEDLPSPIEELKDVPFSRYNNVLRYASDNNNSAVTK